jgi:hypothetical protein
LVQKGRAHITPLHGREAARTRFLGAIEAVMQKKPKPSKMTQPNPDQRYRLSLHYEQLCQRIRDRVQMDVPQDAKIICVSKGDESLLKLNGREGWHFPQTADGIYAGSYPASSAEAIAHLEELRAKGGDFLLFPSTAFWWLEHYEEFRQHLMSRYQEIVRQDDTCLIFALREPQGSARHHE